MAYIEDPQPAWVCSSAPRGRSFEQALNLLFQRSIYDADAVSGIIVRSSGFTENGRPGLKYEAHFFDRDALRRFSASWNLELETLKDSLSSKLAPTAGLEFFPGNVSIILGLHGNAKVSPKLLWGSHLAGLSYTVGGETLKLSWSDWGVGSDGQLTCSMVLRGMKKHPELLFARTTESFWGVKFNQAEDERTYALCKEPYLWVSGERCVIDAKGIFVVGEVGQQTAINVALGSDLKVQRDERTPTRFPAIFNSILGVYDCSSAGYTKPVNNPLGVDLEIVKIISDALRDALKPFGYKLFGWYIADIKDGTFYLGFHFFDGEALNSSGLYYTVSACKPVFCKYPEAFKKPFLNTVQEALFWLLESLRSIDFPVDLLEVCFVDKIRSDEGSVFSVPSYINDDKLGHPNNSGYALNGVAAITVPNSFGGFEWFGAMKGGTAVLIAM